MRAALSGFASGTRRYLVVSTIFGLIVAVLDTIALALIGVPLPVVWGLFSFITNYVPNIGFVIGLIPPALLGLLEGGPWTMLAVVAVYCVINVIIQSVIQPKVVGDVVGLTATLSFLSLVFWTWVIGPLGATRLPPTRLPPTRLPPARRRPTHPPGDRGPTARVRRRGEGRATRPVVTVRKPPARRPVRPGRPSSARSARR